MYPAVGFAAPVILNRDILNAPGVFDDPPMDMPRKHGVAAVFQHGQDPGALPDIGKLLYVPGIFHE
jgi:hypothetical protein